MRLRLTSGLGFVVAVWAVSRAFFFAVGAIGHAFIREADSVGSYPEPPGALGYWAHWDGGWFSHIAENGYDSVNSTAFFPLFPLLLRGVSELGLGLAVAGALISTVAALAALYFVYATAVALWDERVARGATIAFAAFPTAFYLNAVYSEALFTALTGGALWALYARRDLLLAGAFGYFAALSRVFGVFLVLVFAFEWLRRRREFGWLSLGGVFAPLVALATYGFFLWRGSGNPLLFRAAQEEGWGRIQTEPVSNLARAWDRAGDGLPWARDPTAVFETTSANPPFGLAHTVDFAFAVLLLVLVVLGLRLLPAGLALYSLPAAYAAVATPAPLLALASLPRYVLAVLPLFFVLGRVFAGRIPLLVAWTAVTLVVGAYLTLMFVTWRWVA